MVTPRRIASLLSSGTEILYALGLGDRVVAVSHECDYPPEIAGKPRVTFAHIDANQSSQAIDDQVQQLVAEQAPLYEVDQERLVELVPDLIVTQTQCDVCAVKYDDVINMVDANEVLCGTQVVALNPVSLDDIFRDIQKVGSATGAIDVAMQFVASLRQRVAKIKHVTDRLAVEQKRRVACIEWIQPLMLSANWIPQLVELAGGKYGLAQGDQHSSYGSWTDVVAYDPQVIVIMPCGFDLKRTTEEAQCLTGLDGWCDVSAVKSNRVFAVDGNAYFNRSGPRIVDSLEILAHLVHPKHCQAPASVVDTKTAWCRLRTEEDSLKPVPGP